VVPRLGAGRQVIQPVWVDDIAATTARIVETEDAWDSIYEIGGPTVMSMDEVIRTLLRVLDIKRLIVPVPSSLAKLATALLRVLPRPPMTPQGIDFATQDGLVDLRAVRALGVEPIDLETGLSRYMKAA
jgi:NADH dehydrogenase